MSFVNYRNGNYVVYFNTDTGDKIRNTKDVCFNPRFAENCDVTITDKCDGGCPFCYAGCTPDGKHGDLNAKFLDTLHPYTELAVNGNDLSHPDLIPFLQRMRKQRIIVNMTLNQKHFEEHFDRVERMQRELLIHGIGVSLNSVTESFIKKVSKVNNVVIHVINGIFNKEEAERLYGYDFNLLILGYKTTNRGQLYLSHNREDVEANRKWLRSDMQIVFKEFKTVQFDNLALEQLNVREMVSEEMWKRHYMGEDGDFTFFINLVDGYFAMNSTSNIHYPLMDSVDEMFDFLQMKRNGSA